MEPAGAATLTIELPHGTRVGYSATGQRLLELDRHGHPLAQLAWRDDGALASAAVRLPDRSWLAIEPGAVTDAPWGRSDRLWHRDTPLTIFAALDYSRIAFLPPLAEPARVPPGGGTAVLNLLASLAVDQRCERLMYRGPYASEQLFLALLESFHYEPECDDPLQAFMTGTLAWRPAPHERVLAPDGVCVQLREGVEKVTWQGRVYYRSAWQGVRRHAERRVRDVNGGVCCSLWALDAPLEDHLRMDARGEGVTLVAVEPPAPDAIPAPPGVLAGLAAVVAARSTRVLGPFIRQAAATLRLEWAPLPGDLVALHDSHLQLSNRLLPVMDARRSLASTPGERAGVAIAFLAELAHLAGDLLRSRAQAILAALPESAQRAILEADRGLPDEEVARAIGVAVRALQAWPLPTRPRAGSA